jgi:hypothetical protein
VVLIRVRVDDLAQCLSRLVAQCQDLAHGIRAHVRDHPRVRRLAGLDPRDIDQRTQQRRGLITVPNRYPTSHYLAQQPAPSSSSVRPQLPPIERRPNLRQRLPHSPSRRDRCRAPSASSFPALPPSLCRSRITLPKRRQMRRRLPDHVVHLVLNLVASRRVRGHVLGQYQDATCT